MRGLGTPYGSSLRGAAVRFRARQPCWCSQPHRGSLVTAPAATPNPEQDGDRGDSPVVGRSPRRNRPARVRRRPQRSCASRSALSRGAPSGDARQLHAAGGVDRRRGWPAWWRLSVSKTRGGRRYMLRRFDQQLRELQRVRRIGLDAIGELAHDRARRAHHHSSPSPGAGLLSRAPAALPRSATN